MVSRIYIEMVLLQSRAMVYPKMCDMYSSVPELFTCFQAHAVSLILHHTPIALARMQV
jgi:hypothetical protein